MLINQLLIMLIHILNKIMQVRMGMIIPYIPPAFENDPSVNIRIFIRIQFIQMIIQVRLHLMVVYAQRLHQQVDRHQHHHFFPLWLQLPLFRFHHQFLHHQLFQQVHHIIHVVNQLMYILFIHWLYLNMLFVRNKLDKLFFPIQLIMRNKVYHI